MKTKILKVKITFLEPVLGTWPSNQNVARDFIASKSPDAATIEDEVAALGADAVADKGMTVFPRNENGEPVLYDYQIKGFFKDSCGMLARVGGKASQGRRADTRRSAMQRKGIALHGYGDAGQRKAQRRRRVAQRCEGIDKPG